jgi:hypothetical protein
MVVRACSANSGSGADIKLAMDISCHSFIRMARLAEPLMKDHGVMGAIAKSKPSLAAAPRVRMKTISLQDTVAMIASGAPPDRRLYGRGDAEAAHLRVRAAEEGQADGDR